MIPEEYDTPLYWGEEERRHLAGTNVLLLTKVRTYTHIHTCIRGWLFVCM